MTNVFGYNSTNVFDQDLNTFDSVDFDDVTVTAAITQNQQLATKLYVDTNGGGGGNMTYTGTTPATDKIYKALASNGHDALESSITDNGILVTTTQPIKCSSITKNVDSSNFDIGDNQLTVAITAFNGMTSNKVKVNGGTNQQYLMADGTLLEASAQNGNANFYLYNNINGVSSPPPSSGDVSYNATTLSATTIVYINHITRDFVDIGVYFGLITTLDDLYIQDQSNSLNFAKFNIISAPTIVPNSYISIPVAMVQSGGTGSTAFGSNHDILVSFFSNLQEVNTRLTALEDKTQNQSAIALTTTFNQQITVPIIRVQSIASQTVNVNDKVTIGTANNYVEITSILGLQSKNYIVIGATASQFLKGDGTLDSSVYLTTATLPATIFQGYPFNPFQNATTTITTGSKSYFYTVRINRPTAINGFAMYVSSGSDPLRVGIYRGYIRGGGPVATGTLVGESASTPVVTAIPYTTGTIVAKVGQNLNFTTGEYMILAFGSNGITNTYWSSPATGSLNPDLAFNGTSNYVASGFPVTASVAIQGVSLASKICMELY